MSEEHEGISENRVTFYRIQGHNHDGENSTLIDFSKYDLSDIIDLSQFNAAVLGTIENNVIRPIGAIVGIGDALVEVDGSRPEAISGLTVTSTAHATSPGNILINVSWDPPTGGNAISYIVQLHKSEAGVGGSYVLIESHDTTAFSHIFQFVDNAAGDVGSIYYKVKVIALSPAGLRSLAAETTVAPATDSSVPANITFNDSSTAFDEGVKAAFKGIFVRLNDNTEFDVKQGRGQYEYQVSTTKVAGNFDNAANLKADGRANSTFFLVNNLDVRASAGGAKTNYYLRVRAIDTSNNAGTWVYYKNTADGGSSGTGTTTASAASAINVLDIDGAVDIAANTITANEIYAGTITAQEIFGGTITATELNALLSFESGGNMQSSDYASSGGTTGWKIFGGDNTGSGSAIFENITARGVIKANTGEIGGTDGWVIAANAIQSNSSISAANTIVLSTDGGGTAFFRLGAKTTYSAANTGIWMDPANGLVIGSGAGNFSVDISGVITASAGTIGGWTIGVGKIHSTADADPEDEGPAITIDDVVLGLTNQAFSIGDGRAVMRRYRFAAAGNGVGDVKIGIDASAGMNPIYDTAGDMLMWWDESAQLAKFSLSNKLLFDGTNLTLVDGTITSGTIQTAASGSRLMLSPVNALPDVTVDTGTAQAGASTTITLKSGSSSTNDYYNDLTITLASGPGSGDVRTISDYVGSSKVATVSAAWTTNPTSSTTYSITRKTNTFLRGYTGNATEDYPGFIYYYGERDLVTQSRQWGRVAFSAPKFSATIALSGFVFSHSDDGHGELNFGLPYNTDQFVIADTGSSSTPTNTFNRGGITIVSGTPASTNNTLYADGTTLKWHGAAIGGGSGVDSIIAGSNISVSGATGDVTVTATNTTYVGSSPITLAGNTFGFNETLIGGTGHNHNGSTIKAASGTSAAPGLSFSDDANLGWYRSAENVMTFTAGNSIRLHLSQQGMSNWPGTVTLPSYSFLNDANTGMWHPAADTIAFSTAQYERVRIDSSGRLGVGEDNPSYTIHSGGTIYATSTLYAASNSFHNGACSPWISNASNLGSTSYYWDDFYHSGSTQTSDVSLKENIEDATYGLDFINTLRPVTYTKKTGGTGRNGPRTHHGFIAQEIETLLGDDADHIALWADGYHPAVSAEDDPSGIAQDEGHVQGLRYVEFIPILTKAIQELEARLAALEA